jgi:hypothetical protein
MSEVEFHPVLGKYQLSVNHDTTCLHIYGYYLHTQHISATGDVIMYHLWSKHVVCVCVYIYMCVYIYIYIM